MPDHKLIIVVWEMVAVRIGGPAGTFNGFSRTWRDLESVAIEQELKEARVLYLHTTKWCPCCRVEQKYLYSEPSLRIIYNIEISSDRLCANACFSGD